MVDGVRGGYTRPTSAPVLPLNVTNVATFDYDPSSADPQMWWEIEAPADGVVWVQLDLADNQDGQISLQAVAPNSALGPDLQYPTDDLLIGANVRPGDRLFVGAWVAETAPARVYTSMEDVYLNYGDGIYQMYFPDYQAFVDLILGYYGTEQAFVDEANSIAPGYVAGPTPLTIKTTFVETEWSQLSTGQRTYVGQNFQPSHFTGATHGADINSGMGRSMVFRNVPVAGIPALTECAWRTTRRWDARAAPNKPPGNANLYNWTWDGSCPVMVDIARTINSYTAGWCHARVGEQQGSDVLGASRILSAEHNTPVQNARPGQWLASWAAFQNGEPTEELAEGMARFIRRRVAAIRVRPDEAIDQPYVGPLSGATTWYLTTKTKFDRPNGWGPRPTLDPTGSYPVEYAENAGGPENFIADAELQLAPYAGGDAPFVELPEEMVAEATALEKGSNVTLVAIATIPAHLTDTPPSYPVYPASGNWAEARQGVRLAFQVDFVEEWVDVPIPVMDEPEPVILADQRGRRRIFS